MKLFISYARKNRAKVESLQTILRRAGHEAWFDEEISGGEEWWRSIVTSIQSCDVFIFALSPESTASDACAAEFQYALDLNKPILPVMLEDAELPIGSLQTYQYITATDLKSSDTILELSKALTKLSERINADEFPPPDPFPSDPKFPFPPDPFEAIRGQISNLRNLSEDELLRMVHEIQKTARSSQRTSNEARKLLNKIATNTSLPYGVVELAKAAQKSLPQEQEQSALIYIVAAVIFVVVLGTILFSSGVLKPSSTPPTISSNPTSTPTITNTATLTATETRKPTATATLTETLTAIPTAAPTTLTSTATVTPTLSPRGFLLLTQTAAAFTATTTAAPTNTSTRAPLPVISVENAAQVQEISPTLDAHTSTVRTIDFSPDGTLFATGSSDETAEVWNTHAHNQEWPTIDKHDDWVTGVSFSPNGELLATASRDGDVFIWDVATREQIYQPPISEQIWAIDFGPDSNLLALGLGNGQVEIWDIPNKTLLITLENENQTRIFSLDFNQDGTLLVTGGIDGTVRIWDIVSGTELQRFATVSISTDVLPQVLAVSFSPDGRYIASGDNAGVSQIWDVQTGSLLSTFSGNTVWGIDFSNDGHLLAVGSENHNVYLWNWSTGTTSATLRGHTQAVRSVVFSPDGRLLISGDEGGNIRFWGVPN